MKTRTFELPVDGLFHISGVNSILRAVKKAFPDMQVLQRPDRRSLYLVVAKKLSVAELLETVGDITDLILTKVQQKAQCPVCGMGAIYGWTRPCHDCKRNQEEFTTLFQLEPLFDAELDRLEFDEPDEYEPDEYALLLAELDELEAAIPTPSLFEVPFGDAQGAFPDEMVKTILQAAKIEYNASFQVGEESVVVTIPQGGLTEADLLALASPSQHGFPTPLDRDTESYKYHQGGE